MDSFLKQKNLENENVVIGNVRLSKTIIEDNFVTTERFDLAKDKTSLYKGVSGKVDAVGRMYFGVNTVIPRIGDVRVRYNVAPHKEISVMGKYSKGRIETFQTKTGESMLWVEDGKKTSKQIMEAEQSNAALILWLTRIFGLLLLFVAPYFIWTSDKSSSLAAA